MTAVANGQVGVSVVVVSLGAREALLECLQHLRECNLLESSPGSGTQVVVSDLGDEPDVAAQVADAFPCVTFVREETQSSFARACNLGIEAARGTHILLLDPCTRIPGRLLSDLLMHLDRDPTIAAVGPTIAGSIAPTSCTLSAIPDIEATESPTAASSPGEVETVDWLPASCLLLNRKAYSEVGPFEEGSLMTLEEIDWCRRAYERGWRIDRLPSVSVELIEPADDHGGDGESADRLLGSGQFSRNRRRHFRAQHGLVAAMAVDAVDGAKRLVRNAKAAMGLAS